MSNLKKYISLSLIAAILISAALCFAGCGEQDSELDFGSHDKLEIDGYYLKTVNSVEDEGVILETNYYVCSDEELQNPVGTLTARFDEDGELLGYDAAISEDDKQRVISFSKSKESSGYTDSMYASDYSAILSTAWESISIKWDEKERYVSTGMLTYFPNGVEKVYSENQYITKNGKEYLSCAIERLRNEDGSLASEKITNYDENGNVKQ